MWEMMEEMVSMAGGERCSLVIGVTEMAPDSIQSRSLFSLLMNESLSGNISEA